MFAFLASCEMVISFVANIGFVYIYKSTVDIFDSMIFYIFAGITVFALFIVMYVNQ